MLLLDPNPGAAFSDNARVLTARAAHCTTAVPPTPCPPPTAAYAFYMQPIVMTLLPEMPMGRAGTQTLRRAVRTTLYGVALAIYVPMGTFGAAIFGRHTKGCVQPLPSVRIVAWWPRHLPSLHHPLSP